MRPSDPRLRRQLAPARGSLIGVVTSGVVASVLVIAQAWTITGLILAVLDGQGVVFWATAVVIVMTSRAAVTWAGDVLASRAASLIASSLRRQIVAVLIRRPAASSSGARSVLATRGVAAAEPYLTRYLPALILAMVLPALTLITIATQDLLSAGIIAATLPLVPLFGALVGLATRDRAERQWRSMASLSGHFVDVMRGLPTLVAYRRAHVQSRRIGEVTEGYRRASVQTLRLAFASSAVLELVATLSVALVAVTVGVRLAGGNMALGTALFVLLLAPEAYWPLRRVGAEFHAAAEGVATFEAVAELLDSQDNETPVGAARPGADLEIDGLQVVYPGRRAPALDIPHLTLHARGVTAITGPSGCGKSTLLAVIAGLPTLAEGGAGSITCAGEPVGGSAWQAQVAWMPQRPLFVEGSIGDNLRLARRDATDAQLWEALRRVALEERVRLMSRGLEQPLEEDGRSLSAGERARLALARVVLADRPWTLLDEPTAHLDALTEQVIADTIGELGVRGAVVVVAHRPALIALADDHIELDRPVVVASPSDPVPVENEREGEGEGEGEGEQSYAPTPDDQAPGPVRGGFLASTLLGALATASGIALTATAGWLIVQASTRPAFLTLLVAVVGVRTFGLARPVLRYAERLRSHDVALRLLARRRVQVYDALVPLTPARLGRRRGDILTAVVDDVDCVVDAQLRVKLPVRSFALVSALVIAVAMLLEPRAALGIGLVALLGGGGGFVLARHGASRAERSAVHTRGELSRAVVGALQVAPELLMWQRVDSVTDSIGEISDRLGAAAHRSARWWGGARAWVSTITGGAVAVTAVLLAPLLDAGTLSGPIMALLVLLPLALGETASGVADAGAISARTRAAETRLHDLESLQPAVQDEGSPDTVVSSPEVHLLDASARWPDTGRGCSHVSLTLSPGERVALTGSSGSGKSTVAALLLRFLDPTEGEVRLGTTSTRTMTLEEVRSRFALVDDDPHVFASTLFENTRLAKPGSSRGEVSSALRRARLGPWLDALPDGLDTWLGDGHADLSGGERARLGLARAFLSGQPILVLDEPSAHLDHATAADLAREILTGPRGPSILWITHEAVGLDLVDRIVDLDDLDAPLFALDARA
ncbi:thiol reductant ABC exporter subunit CydD [Nocardioides salsibiostraticola]